MDDKTFVLSSFECNEIVIALNFSIKDCNYHLERVRGWVDFPDKIKQQEYIDFLSNKLQTLNLLVSKFS